MYPLFNARCDRGEVMSSVKSNIRHEKQGSVVPLPSATYYNETVTNNKKVASVDEKERCGTLRIGLFFDGTGNDHRSAAKFSNVKKLFDIYPNPIDPDSDTPIINKPKKYEGDITGFPFVQAVYIRGVGSRSKDVYDESLARYKNDLDSAKVTLESQRENLKDAFRKKRGKKQNIKDNIELLENKIKKMEENPDEYIKAEKLKWHNDDYYRGLYETYAGGGLGAGGIARLQGMLYYIDLAIKEYYKEKQKMSKSGKGSYPKNLEFDIFGFSRGAAEARHFVNVLKQEGDWWSIDQHYEKKHVNITSLNIFDTVGSFGVPGKDVDPGFSYHIDPTWISGGITHFIADDEYRYNFDGQFLGSNNTDYPQDTPQEFVVLGAHSDVGGGYTKAMEHGRTNNDLAKVYLNMMYDRCVGYGVPLMMKPDNEAWTVPESIKNLVVYFNKKYDKYGKNLKTAHKRLREWQRAKGTKYHMSDVILSPQKRFRMNHPRPLLKRHSFFPVTGSIADALTASADDVAKKYIFDVKRILKSEKEYVEFVKKSNELYNTYIHVSSDDGVAMGTQKAYAGIPHRTYFTPKKEEMSKLTKQTEILRQRAIEDNCLPTAISKVNIFKTVGQCIAGAGGTYIGSANQTFIKLRGIKLQSDKRGK